MRRKKDYPTWLRMTQFVLQKGVWALAAVAVFLFFVELFERTYG